MMRVQWQSIAAFGSTCLKGRNLSTGSGCVWAFKRGTLVRGYHGGAVGFPVLRDTFSNDPSSPAIIDVHGAHTYEDLFKDSAVLSKTLLESAGVTPGASHLNQFGDLKEANVAYLCPRDYSYTVAKYAIWSAGGTCVPLCTDHPAHELEYYIEDAKVKTIVVHSNFSHMVQLLVDKHKLNMVIIDHFNILKWREDQKASEIKYESALPKAEPELEKRRALIIYTSGTTGAPKGVVSPHSCLIAQINDMKKAWKWSNRDHILHVLPLHHVHGVVNALLTPLCSGAKCEMLLKFNPKTVWDIMLKGSPSISSTPNIFMAVPTIYTFLIDYYEKNKDKLDAKCDYEEGIQYCMKSNLRLMVCGSAALPVSVMRAWEEITGCVLLERYGMTETCMILGNPYEGPRIPGSVGIPFDSVEVRICDVETGAEIPFTGELGEHISGELQASGPTIFKEYLDKPEATAKEFVIENGKRWFRTGDIACRISSEGSANEPFYFKILGRKSVDIIKSGGYKISSLDVERHLLEHPDIEEVAVVGLPDDKFGQKVASVIKLKPGAKSFTLEDLTEWGKPIMAKYKIPSEIRILHKIPRNAMGKVNKKELVKVCF
eukprot:Nk52_evm16s232 gene=Nk52_evmTU16s232